MMFISASFSQISGIIILEPNIGVSQTLSLTGSVSGRQEIRVHGRIRNKISFGKKNVSKAGVPHYHLARKN